MKYSLRSLMIAMLVLPPLFGGLVLFFASMQRGMSNTMTDPLPNDSDLPHYGGGAHSVELQDLPSAFSTFQAPSPNPPKN